MTDQRDDTHLIILLIIFDVYCKLNQMEDELNVQLPNLVTTECIK